MRLGMMGRDKLMRICGALLESNLRKKDIVPR